MRNEAVMLKLRGVIANEAVPMFCTDALNPLTLKIVVVIGVLFATSEAAFFSCGIWIICRVRTMAISVKTKAMHVQLTRLLILQVSRPDWLALMMDPFVDGLFDDIHGGTCVSKHA